MLFWLPAVGAELEKYLALACTLGATCCCGSQQRYSVRVGSSMRLRAVISSAVNQSGQSDENIPLVLASGVCSKMVGTSMDEIWLLAAICCCCLGDTKGEQGLPSNNDAFR